MAKSASSTAAKPDKKTRKAARKAYGKGEKSFTAGKYEDALAGFKEADSLIPSLIAGKFDVMISSISITVQRNLTINFTQPYAFSGMSLLTNKKLTNGFALEDFDSA